MPSARYQLPQHPTLAGPHTKDELYLLVERGSLGRGEIVLDRQTGRSHKVGELIDGMRPPRTQEPGVRIERPAYQEFAGDTPWHLEPADDSGVEDEDVDHLDTDPEYDDYLFDGSGPVGDEQICYHGHPSWFAFWPAMLFCLAVVAGSIYAMKFGGSWFLLGFVVASFIFCCTIIARQHRDYFVTGERVEVEWGILGRSSKEVRIVDIRSIDVDQHGLLAWIGIGNLNFASSGTDGVEVQFRKVRKAHRIKELVRQLQRRAGSDV